VEERERIVVKVFPVLGEEAAAAVGPSDCSLDDLALGQNYKALGPIASSDNFGYQAGRGDRQTVLKHRPCVTMLHGSGVRVRCSRPDLGSCGADVMRASKLQHAVQATDGDDYLGRPAAICARVQTIADHPFVASDWSRDPGALVVPWRLLPPHPAFPGAQLQMAVERGGTRTTASA
jgi:hypothetical protein